MRESQSDAKLLAFIKKEFGGWPILNEREFNASSYDPMTTLINSRLYSLSPFVDVSITANPKNPKIPALLVSQQHT